MSLKDYELLNILDKNTNSKIFKVRHKTTGEHFVWYIIDCENLNKQQMGLEDKFAARKVLQHPNLLEFHDLIKEEGPQLYYLVVKYCKHGSLKDLMDMAFIDNKRFSEEFLCKIIYQIAFAIKTVTLTTQLGIKEIYFDSEYNVKFFNFNINSNIGKLKYPRISSLGALIFEICTLTKFSKKTFEKELKNYNGCYSKEFLSLLITMIKDTRELKKNIDKVMCNAKLLLKITQWNKHKCFLKIDDGNHNSHVKEKTEEIYSSQIEKLREKEINLQKRENSLKEREKKVISQEKKLALMEIKLKERFKQAEETKYSVKKSCNCSSTTFLSLDRKEPPKENLDSTYISCGDSVIMPTSKKLNINEIVKPATFTRTLSEKRIRFKGHSPLKDIDFNRRRSIRNTKNRRGTTEKIAEWTTCSDDTDRSTLISVKTKSSNKKCKQLFHTHENKADIALNGDEAELLQWTKENKKHAFELLRLMNKDKENKPLDVKHTYL